MFVERDNDMRGKILFVGTVAPCPAEKIRIEFQKEVETFKVQMVSFQFDDYHQFLT